ncbi:hypothetical protein ACQP1V_43095 (plasmid) [Microtetraspora malaysiensis]|uniref:hypothetical protein n=1 Tax=Microtetraspora malaysiensis TaxID=161358 RepID=UPI003D91266F
MRRTMVAILMLTFAAGTAAYVALQAELIGPPTDHGDLVVTAPVCLIVAIAAAAAVRRRRAPTSSSYTLGFTEHRQR